MDDHRALMRCSLWFLIVALGSLDSPVVIAQSASDEPASAAEVQSAVKDAIEIRQTTQQQQDVWAQERAELTLELMGHSGLGWEGEGFSQDELDAVRNWLSGKAMSIYGGSYEIQNNIIAKNILGLPENTQRG